MRFDLKPTEEQGALKDLLTGFSKQVLGPVARDAGGRQADARRRRGPEGYSKEHLVEKWFRDIKVYDIFEGTGQIQRVIISRAILGRLDG